MKRIILDTSSIINQPSTMSFGDANVQLFVPGSVADELRQVDLSPGSGSAYLPLIAAAVDAGNAEVLRTTPLTKLPPDAFLSFTDKELVSIAEAQRTEAPDDELIVATDDKTLAAAIARRGITTVTSRELRDKLFAETAADPSLRERAQKIGKYQARHVAFSALGGVAATLLANVIFDNRESILNTINVWALLLPSHLPPAPCSGADHAIG